MSGAALLALTAGALIAGGDVFVALVAGAAAAGTVEFARLAGRLQAAPPLWLAVPVSVWLAIRFSVPASLSSLELGLGGAVVAGLVGVVTSRLSWRGWMAAIAGAVYVGFCLGFFVALLGWRPHDHTFGIWVLVVPLAAVIGCDTTAYFAGSAFGRRRFFAGLSPSKSMEGAAAGLAASILLTAVLAPVLLGINPGLGAAEGVLVAMAAQAGDLAESALKRQAQVKDSSQLIPGHGGLLDRLDSLLLVGPVVYAFLRLISLA